MYKREIKILFLFLLTIIAFNKMESQEKNQNEKVSQVIAKLKEQYAPDKRTSLFNIEYSVENNKVVLKGETNQPKAKMDLLQEVKELKYETEDLIELLPAENLKDKSRGIINVSVANIRTKPDHPEELSTQALLGAPVNVLKKSGDGWYLVQTPDEYIAWVDDDAVALMNKQEFQEWQTSERIIVLSNYATSYSEPDVNSQVVSDLIKGDILKYLQNENGFVEVEYPDKRIGYVEEINCKKFSQWLSELNPDAENIIKTAKTFLGIPYLWGGTSFKGVDCSGFTKSVFFLNGVVLPRDASQQVHVGEFVTDKVDFTKLQPGDLIFFGTKANGVKKERATHVGIYIGNGEYIHSSGYVRINSLDKEKSNFIQRRYDTFLRAKRILTSLDKNGVHLIRSIDNSIGKK